MKTLIRPLFALVSAMALAAVAISPAQAAPRETASPVGGVSDVPHDLPQDLLRQVYGDLLASDAPRTLTDVDADGMILTTFTLPTGSEFTFETPEVAAQLGGGWDGQYGLYVEFNRTDQGVLLAGGGGALAVAMCAIPAVGVPLCIVAGGVVAAATTALAAHGLCRNIMRVYAQMLGYPECR